VTLTLWLREALRRMQGSDFQLQPYGSWNVPIAERRHPAAVSSLVSRILEATNHARAYPVMAEKYYDSLR
jgi:hypothetical protein